MINLSTSLALLKRHILIGLALMLGMILGLALGVAILFGALFLMVAGLAVADAHSAYSFDAGSGNNGAYVSTISGRERGSSHLPIGLEMITITSKYKSGSSVYVVELNRRFDTSLPTNLSQREFDMITLIITRLFSVGQLSVDVTSSLNGTPVIQSQSWLTPERFLMWLNTYSKATDVYGRLKTLVVEFPS